MGTRAPLISSAVFFLRDPSTANSPLAQRISFLESKGLSPQEIEQAISQANGPAQQQPYYAGPRGGRMSREYERDWRDWFIMAVVGGSVGWVALKLAQVSRSHSDFCVLLWLLEVQGAEGRRVGGQPCRLLQLSRAAGGSAVVRKVTRLHTHALDRLYSRGAGSRAVLSSLPPASSSRGRLRGFGQVARIAW